MKICLLCGGPAHTSAGCPNIYPANDYMALQELYIQQSAIVKKLEAERDALKVQLENARRSYPGIGDGDIRAVISGLDALASKVAGLKADCDRMAENYLEQVEARKEEARDHSAAIEQRDALRARVDELEEAAQVWGAEVVSSRAQVAELNDTVKIITDQVDFWGKSATHWRKEAQEFHSQVEVLTEALERIAGCRWVIAPPDRMDAVRAIARAALAKVKEVKP